MEGVEKIREGLYIKKSLGEYRVVYPIKNDDGSFNWKNFLIGGSYLNLIKTALIVLALIALTLSYNHDVKECSTIANYVATHPCEYCMKVTQANQSNQRLYDSIYDLNLTNIIPSS